MSDDMGVPTTEFEALQRAYDRGDVMHGGLRFSADDLMPKSINFYGTDGEHTIASWEVARISKSPRGIYLSVGGGEPVEIESKWIPDLAMGLLRVALDPTFTVNE